MGPGRVAYVQASNLIASDPNLRFLSIFDVGISDWRPRISVFKQAVLYVVIIRNLNSKLATMIYSNPGPHTDGEFWLLNTIAPVLLLFVAIALFISPYPAQGNDESTYSRWTTGWDFKQSYVYSSLYTKHYDPDPDHVNDQNMLGFEGQTKDKRVMGLAVFDNSFGQESQYLYVGRKWPRPAISGSSSAPS